MNATSGGTLLIKCLADLQSPPFFYWNATEKSCANKNLLIV